jgi:ABC-type phosphate transport system substrate-binding protein
MRIRKHLTLGLAGLLLGLSMDAASAEVVLIVSNKSSVPALRVEQVSDIFLGRVGSFPSPGGAAVPLDQPEDSSIRLEFYAKTTGKSPSLLRAYWSRLIFTGKGQPPKEVGNSAAIKKLVAGHPNLIGYVDSSAVDDSVKVVLVLR